MSIDIFSNESAECMFSKKWTKDATVIRNNQFIICTLASFSSKDSKYVFECAVFFKAMIVYA